jgi:hypothetical protein
MLKKALVGLVVVPTAAFVVAVAVGTVRDLQKQRDRYIGEMLSTPMSVFVLSE